MKNTHVGMLLEVTLQTCKFTKINTPLSRFLNRTNCAKSRNAPQINELFGFVIRLINKTTLVLEIVSKFHLQKQI